MCQGRDPGAPAPAALPPAALAGAPAPPAPPPAAPAEPAPSADYDLKIDEQVEKFLELKQKLTYFLITAAVGSIAYTLDFAVDHLASVLGYFWRSSLLLAGAVSALASVATVLFALYNETASFRLHLRYRYQRKRWEQIPEKEQKHWEAVNKRARAVEGVAFVLLCFSVTAQVAFFVLYLHF